MRTGISKKATLDCLFLAALAGLWNLAVQISLDLAHARPYLPMMGTGSVIGASPFAGAIGLIASQLVLLFHDPTVVFRLIPYFIALVAWLAGRRMGGRIGLAMAAVFSFAAASFSYSLLHSIAFYDPFQQDVRPYLSRLNHVTLAGIDSSASLLAGATIYFIASRLRDKRGTKWVFMSLAILPLVAVPIGLRSAIAEDNAIARYLPSRPSWNFHVTRMDYVWTPLGAKGVNNYYVPKARFERGDPHYQAWVGVYWVQGRYGVPSNWTVDQKALYALAVVDQDFWLSQHGYHTPETVVAGVRWHRHTRANWTWIWLAEGSFSSQSDVPPHEEVLLDGYFASVYSPKWDRTAIFYACSTSDAFDEMHEELFWFVQNIDWASIEG